MQNSLNENEKESELKEKNFWKNYGECFGIQIHLQNRKAMRRFIRIFTEGFSEENEILDAFQSFLEAYQYEQIQLCMRVEKTHQVKSDEKSHFFRLTKKLLRHLPIEDKTRLAMIRELNEMRGKSPCNKLY